MEAAARISFCQVRWQPSSMLCSLDVGLPAGISAALPQGSEPCMCCLKCSAQQGTASIPQQPPSNWSLLALQRDGWDGLIVTAADSINRHVVSTLLEKYALVKHCDALRRYLLLGQGDFVQSLMDQVGWLLVCQKLALAAMPIAFSGLQSFWPGCSRSCSRCELAGRALGLPRVIGLCTSSLLSCAGAA